MKLPLMRVYQRAGTSRVLSAGYAWDDAVSCRAYLGSRVASRLKEGDGAQFLQGYLERMPDTGFSLTHLRAEAANSKPPRDWEVGEAFVEAVLEDHFECVFPWPTPRDQREKEGHATGPDLPGYHMPTGEPGRYAFGEVKSTEQQKSPPAVVAGVDGKAGKETLVGQLRRLLTESSRRQILIAWLGFRESREAKGTVRFDSALKRYGETGDCLILGCLVSGKRTASEADLAEACSVLEGSIAQRELWLLAFHLPFEKKEWPSLVVSKGGRA